jgi:hypothetical protein
MRSRANFEQIIQDVYDPNKHALRFTGGGASAYVEVDTYADLPDATTVTGEVYLVLNATGIWPFTRKQSGLYFSNGASWSLLNALTPSDIATMYESNADVNRYTNDDKALVSGATSANTPSTLVLRNASGNFSAGIITADLIGNASTATSSANFSGSLMGDVTGIQGATVITALSNSKLANMAASTIKGNATPGAAAPTDLTGTQVTVLLDTFTSGLKGLVPASGGGTTTFLRADGTFSTLPAAGITDLTGDVTATGPGSSAATVVQVGGKLAAAIATSVNDTLAATAINTASTIVKRDSSGNFAAGTITGNVTGTAANVTGIVAKANGGTGADNSLVTFPSTGVIVTTAATETLTNKTLTAPAISSPTGLVKADVGLGNVDNTADTAKPVSTAQGAANTAVQAFSIQRANHTGTQSAATVTGLATVATSGSHTDLSNIGTNTHAQIDTHIASTTNPHATTKAQVGLGNVDNTSDLNKPVSTAQQTALDGRAFQDLSNISGSGINNNLFPEVDGVFDIGASGSNWNKVQTKILGYDGATSINLDSKKIFDGATEESIDFGARILKDDASVGSVQWNARALVDGGGTESLNWQSRYLADDSEVVAINYNDRQLIASNGITNILDFSSSTGPSSITQSPGNNSTKVATTAYADASANVPFNSINDFIYGAGTDGNVTLSAGTTTLTQDMAYNNLTINGSGKLSTNGFRVFVRGTLDLSAAPAGAIENVTTNGGNAAGTAAGTQSGVPNSGTIGAGQRGQAGIAGGTAAGTAGGAANTTNTLAVNLGGRGGAGGLGTSGAGGAAGSLPNASNQYIVKRYDQAMQRAATLVGGGSQGSSGGSGGGDGAAGGGSGASGSSGGIVWLAAKTINRGAGTAAGAIRALGGNGGNGAQPAVTGNRGGGGGAGGGAGGYVFLVFNTLTGTTKTGLIQASGGSGGSGGNGIGTGIGGAGGANGGGGTVFKLDLVQSAYTITTGPVSVLGANAVGGTGGAGTAIVTFGVDL